MTYINKNLNNITFDKAGVSEEEAKNSQNVLKDNKWKAESKNLHHNKKSKKTTFNNKNTPITINEKDSNNEPNGKPLILQKMKLILDIQREEKFILKCHKTIKILKKMSKMLCIKLWTITRMYQTNMQW